MRAILLLPLLAACDDHPGKRDRADPVELDPRFGTLVDVPIPILGTTTVATAGKGGADWLAIWTDAGVDENLKETEESFEIYRLDPDDGFAATAIDLPEVVDRDFYLWHALQPDQALIAFPTMLFAYDGEGWAYIDPPPALAHADAAYVLLDSDRLFAASGGLVAVWDGGSWRSVPAPEGSTLGPLERDRFRTVSAGPCTIEWDFATLASQPPICAFAGEAVGWSVNGDVDAFHTFDQGASIRRFADGAWSEPSAPDYAGAVGVTTNAPDRVLMTFARGPRLSEARAVDLGASDDVLFPATDATIACECDRSTDPECPCVNPAFALSQTVYAADGETLDLMLFLDVNGTRELRARRFGLPVAVTPFSAEDVP